MALDAEKLQLVAFHKKIDNELEYEKTVMHLSVDGQIILYSDQASDLGVIRSTEHGILAS